MSSDPDAVVVPLTDETRDVLARALWAFTMSGWDWASFRPDADAVMDALAQLGQPRGRHSGGH